MPKATLSVSYTHLLDRGRAAALFRGVDAAHAAAQGERPVFGHRPAAARIDGHQRPGARRQAAGHRRPIRGDPRTTRWVLPSRCAGSRRGDRHCRQHSRGAQGHRRDPARVGDRGLASGTGLSSNGFRRIEYKEKRVSTVRVLVGTRKGAFVLTSDGKRQQWNVSGPHFGGWEIYHVKGSPADPNRLYASQSTGCLLYTSRCV